MWSELNLPNSVVETEPEEEETREEGDLEKRVEKIGNPTVDKEC